MEWKEHENWLDRPINAFKESWKNKAIRSKDIKKKFLKVMKDNRDHCNPKRIDFNNNMSLHLEGCFSSQQPDSNSARTILNETEGKNILKVLKTHLRHDQHWVGNLITNFFLVFNDAYGQVCRHKSLSQLFTQTSKFIEGEVTDLAYEIGSTIYEAKIPEEIQAKMEQAFSELKCTLDVLVNSIPLYYSGLIERAPFLLIRDELTNFIISQNIQGKTYQLLFTFARALTVSKEAVLAKVIFNNLSEEAGSKTAMIENLYNRIDPTYRRVRIERGSFFESIKYSPKDEDFTSWVEGFNHRRRVSQAEYVQVKYENASQKLSSLDYWWSPLEKICMVRSVAESIKRDGSIVWGEDETGICADTLISIFSYISTQTNNHLLYAHHYFTQTLLSGFMTNQLWEGYYLWILEAALSLICDKMDKTYELMITISNFECSLDCKEEDLLPLSHQEDRVLKDLDTGSENASTPTQPTPTKETIFLF